MSQDNFLSEYLSYTAHSEVPVFFHRWSCISGIAAILGRQYYFQHGYAPLYPNLYVMLIGSPGTRKNTAINIMKGLLLQSGYDTIAADKTTKEKFLMDLAGIEVDLGAQFNGYKGRFSPGRGGNRKSMDDILDSNLWGEGKENDETKPPAEMFIVAPEFNDFLGNGNIEFISLLGNLWDYNGIYSSRIKNGQSIAITNPTISIIGGNTPTGFSLAFPTEIFGQGFFSRLLLIYGEPSGRKITFPKTPSIEDTAVIVSSMVRIRREIQGHAELTAGASMLLDKIYKSWPGLEDVRFESYANRRFTHLIKLALTISAIGYSKIIEEYHIIYANTILSHTETLMPRALGEFGKAKNSDVTHKIMKLLEATHEPMNIPELWASVSMDLDKMSQLQDILFSLRTSDKVLYITGIGKQGFIAKKKIVSFDSNDDTVDWSILTEEERKLA